MMNAKLWITSSLYFGLIGGFSIRCIAARNYEFLFYAPFLVLFWIFIIRTEKKLHYPGSTLSLLVFWLALHLIGGTLTLGTTRLYDLVLIPIVGEPYSILRFDQAIHLLCYIVMTRFVFVPIMAVLRDNAPVTLIALVTILTGCGIGALNEVIEFFAVILFDAGDQVGGYTNTALDMVANLGGAVIAWFTLLPHVKSLRAPDSSQPTS